MGYRIDISQACKNNCNPPTIIILDPGHGQVLGDDGKYHFQRPATSTFGLREDNLTLAIAQNAENHLNSLGYKVVMTRITDKGLYPGSCGAPNWLDDTIPYCERDVEARWRLAYKIKANATKGEKVVFVSIHTNGGSIGRKRRGRTQSFYCDDPSLEVRVDSFPLSMSLLDQITSVFPLNIDYEAKGGYFDCSYTVLHRTNSFEVPGSIVEVLYHSHPDDELILNDPVALNRAGIAITRAVEQFAPLSK